MFRWLAILVLLPGVARAQAVDQLPAYLLDVPPALTTVLVAETDAATLHRFSNGPEGLAHADRHDMSIGQNGVGKRRPWDRRTPLGIYFVTEQLDTTRLHDRYGATAFPLDYPNTWDRINRRAGDGIWLHGVDESGGKRPPRDTDGCIALPNDEILALAELLQPTATPVVIARDIEWVSPAEIRALRDEVLQALDAWAASIRGGDLHRYLSLYADDFGYRGMTREQWLHYRVVTLGASPIEDFRLEDVLLLADPEEEGLFLSRFRQVIVGPERTVETTKRLYWRRDESGGLEIVAEDNG